jgi:N-acetyl-gamma-glutamylphosphate reductase
VWGCSGMTGDEILLLLTYHDEIEEWSFLGLILFM